MRGVNARIEYCIYLFAPIPALWVFSAYSGALYQEHIGWARLTSLLLLGPILEEFVFREVIWQWQTQRRYCQRGLSLMLVNSLGFVLLHQISQAPQLLPLWYAAGLWLCSLVFCRVRQRSQHWQASAALHAYYNLAWLLTASK